MLVYQRVPLNYDHQIVEKLAEKENQICEYPIFRQKPNMVFSVRENVSLVMENIMKKIAVLSWLSEIPMHGFLAGKLIYKWPFRHEEVIAGWNLEKTEARQPLKSGNS